MAFLRFLRVLLWLALLGAAALLLLLTFGRAGPAVRGSGIDLGAPLGMGTAARIAALDGQSCRALLGRAGIAYRALPLRNQGASCGFRDGIGWKADGARAAHYQPAAPPLACPLAAALAVWEWEVVQPAAVRAFGTTVAEIDHYGTYACRRLYGRRTGDWSEHARAAAIDVAGFRLADGRRVTVAADWKGSRAEALFLHEVRDGACRLFGTTLSPDYNAAHHDHLHLDEARRGGWRVCR